MHRWTVLAGVRALPGQVLAEQSLTPRLPPGLGSSPSASVHTVESSLCPHPTLPSSSLGASEDPGPFKGSSPRQVPCYEGCPSPPHHLGTEKNATSKCWNDSLT